MKNNPITFKIPVYPYLKEPYISLRDGTLLKAVFLPACQQNHLEANVVGRLDDGYIIKNHHGVEIEYPKQLFDYNKKEIVNGKIKLGYHEYRHCFIYGRNNAEEKLFFDHFNLLYKHRQFIMSDSRYFLIRIPSVLVTVGMYTGSDDYCLGGLFESWNLSRKLYTYLDKTGEKIRIINIGGSQLTSMHSWTGWGEESKKIFYGCTGGLLEKLGNEYTHSKIKLFGPVWAALRNIGLRYPDYCNVDHADLKELIDKLKSMDN